MSQNDLARVTGIPQSTIYTIENEQVGLGVELVSPLRCHRAVLVFLIWVLDTKTQQKQ